jgi:ribose transport system ATP-binding protein
MTTEQPVTLEVANLSKTFSGIQVLREVDLELRGGEIRGLLGQNGSGKSTLIKLLAGYHSPDPGGRIVAAGRELSGPVDAAALRDLGWAFVHQDLALLDNLSVVDNFHLAGLRASSGTQLRWRREREWVADRLETFGVKVSPRAKISDLTGTQRAMVAIVRAATVMAAARLEPADGDAGGLLVLDEPTVYLPERELDELFGLVRRVAAAGAGVLFVSHRLPEVRELTDSVTVLRAGQVTAAGPTKDFTAAQLVRSIVGRDVASERPTTLSPRATENALEVRGASGAQVRGVDVSVRRGEIVGLCGLAGSGFDELPYLLFGAVTASGGMLSVGGEEQSLSAVRPDRAIRLGMAFIPGNRLLQGAVGSLTMRSNLTLTSLSALRSHGGRIDRRRETRLAEHLAERYDVRPRATEQRFAQFSGGNQQKILMAKWLESRPRVLLLHEPVQGLDVEARAQVLEHIRSLARQGVGVIVTSSDFQDIVSVCHRALVFQSGSVVAEVRGDALTEELLTAQSHRVAEAGV